MSQPKTFKDLMANSVLRALFKDETGISDAKLDDALSGDDIPGLVSYLEDDHEVFGYATEFGHCEVIEWRGHYFSGSEWDEPTGPFVSLEEALDPIRYLLECGDENETDTASHLVRSKLGDQMTFKVIAKLVSVNDVVEVNGTMYRRTESGYVKE